MSGSVRCTQLPNGIRLICQPIPWSHTVAVGIWIGVGTQDEPKGEEGIAHFLEHVLFKGTRHKSGRQIAQLIDALGGTIDAFTDKEMTCFHLRVLPDHLPQGLTLLNELLTEPALHPKDIEVEKSVVLAEIQNIDDTPEELVGEIFFEALWDGHPLSRPVLGSKESVREFRRAKLLRFLRHHYTPERIIIAAAGAIESRQFVDLVAQVFGDWKHHASAQATVPPPQPFPTLRVAPRHAEHCYFCFGVPSFPATDPAHYPASLLDIIVGGGASSRLFMEVREKRGLAYTIGSFSVAFKQAGFFAVSGSCLPKDIQKLMRVTAKELRRLKREGLRNGELERAQTQLKLSAVIAQESVTGTMFRLGRQVYYFGQPIPMDEVLRRVDQVTEEEVVAMAQRLFNNGSFATAFVGPVSDNDGERLQEILNGVLMDG